MPLNYLSSSGMQNELMDKFKDRYIGSTGR